MNHSRSAALLLIWDIEMPQIGRDMLVHRERVQGGAPVQAVGLGLATAAEQAEDLGWEPGSD